MTDDKFTMSIVDEFVALLPPHKCGLSIEHNDHRNVYETIADHLKFMDDGPDEFVSQEDYEKAIAGDELWSIHWYPETPVGFYRTYGTTLANALAAAKKP